MLVTGLAPEEIVIVGDLTRQWAKFGPVIEADVRTAALTGNVPRVRPAEGNMARLRGTVALVLQRHFGPSGRFLEQSGTAA